MGYGEYFNGSRKKVSLILMKEQSKGKTLTKSEKSDVSAHAEVLRKKNSSQKKKKRNK